MAAETYQKKTQIDHILLRPDTFIGSIEKHTQSLWVYEDSGITHRSITFVPGLYNIFDEILVNAADNKQRDPSMDAVKVTIDVEQNLVSVYNSGDGVSGEVLQEEGVYVPELIFGHLWTSRNYDDNEKKTTGGKLTNIFSTEFVIETADGKRQKKYKQVFSNNMGNKSEPIITKCKKGVNWTKVSFKPDLAKFNMTHLEDDVVALMKKRVIDIAGCLGETVKVELNGQRVPVKSFLDYVNLYLQSASKAPFQGPCLNLPLSNFIFGNNYHSAHQIFFKSIRIAEKVNDSWEICVSLSEGQFQQFSFVNSIATIKGGTHVDYITNQIINHVMSIVNKKNKNSNLKVHMVQNHLWIFVNALIANPAFDSQTKETLTIRQSSFGSKCELSQEFLKKVAKSGVVESLLLWADFKQSKDLKITDGTKTHRITGITKLEDANDAGGKYSDRCTLILTEGDSAKALAVIVESVHRAGISVVGRNYYGVFPLRGKLLNVREASQKQIMENAEIQIIKQILGLQHGKEYDSVKALRYGHLMITTDQATHRNGKVLSFYSIPEYESWRESLVGSASGWSIKYYKPGTYLDQKEKLIKYSDFVNKELILFSMADLQQSIPSMVDGLKPGQRKILFCSFKCNFVKEAKVAQFSGYVSEHSAYHHGEQSLASTIIGMAQDYVGSNNINLLQPNGQFGTRHLGGKDHASARYIYTCLSPITRFLFPKDDDILLDYLNEDGQSIEPTWYMPIIPMVLVNGSEGIGTGWSSYVPKYSPRDIVANVRHLLNGEPMEAVDPGYKGFRGTFEKTATKDSGVSYTITGIIEEVNDTTLRISELPIRQWTQDYKEFLESIMTGNDKIKYPFIKDYREHNDDTIVHFEVILSEEKMMVAKQEGLLKKFKLTTTTSTSKCTFLEDFFNTRLEFYEKRKKVLLDNLEMELLKLDNKVRFILGVVKGEIIVSRRKRAELFIELSDKGFTPFPEKTKTVDAAVARATDDAEEAEENSEVVAGSKGVRASDYEYLLSMANGTLTLEKVQELCADRDELREEVDELSKATPKSLRIKDLDALERGLDEQDKNDVQAEAARKKMKSSVMGEAVLKAVTKQAPKNPRKNNKKTDDTETVSEAMETSSSAVETDNIQEVAKPEGRAGPKEAPARKPDDVIGKMYKKTGIQKELFVTEVNNLTKKGMEEGERRKKNGERQNHSFEVEEKEDGDERSRLIKEVIQTGVIPCYVEFLTREDFPQLQFEAAWALTKIAFGTTKHTNVVIDHGAVPIFVKLLDSPSDDVREQSWGYVAGDSAKFCDLVLGHGALLPLLLQLNEHAKLSMLRKTTWTLQNSVGARHKFVVMSHPSSTVLIHALRTVGNIVCGSDMQTQVL
ncbi:hypothetical protein RHGRI_000924 [Rhododendron griersonianum]|uniref:DNA topoisomerase 2 n=1 Tax=Rhododendron griersonianum TaxID=479676 RepID=A0AAV6LJJ3_9ERIC|nr:hypothetical protein RHGRI_000924 [Rhododendron griersonianum]